MRTSHLYPVVLGVAGVQSAYFWSRLPARIATHDGVGGEPNGWMSRPGLFLFYFALLAFLTVVFLGVGALTRVLPASLVNMPNRQFWLAPERRAGTVRVLSAMTQEVGLLALVMVVALQQIAFQANLGPHPTLPGAIFWPVFVAFNVYVVAWLVRFYRRFRLPA